MLAVGTRESATVNAILVGVKIARAGDLRRRRSPHFNAANFHPFMPDGGSSTRPAACKLGVLPAASIIFFAFYGFDAISTAAEETKNPGRDLPIGIIGSMVVCTLIYMIVAAAAVGAARYDRFAASPEPLAFILRELGHGGVAVLIGGAAVIALPTVILVVHVRPEPHLLRDGPRRPVARRPRQGRCPLRRADPDDGVDRRAAGDAGRPRAARRDRLAGQCRHAHRLRRRVAVFA